MPARRAADLIWIGVEPAFDRLRGEDRFRAIIAAMDLLDRDATR